MYPTSGPAPTGNATLSGRLWWRTADGADLTLPVGARPGFGRGAASGRAVRPWRVRERRRTAALEQMLRGARRVGTLRSLATGTRYGVFRGRLGPVAWDAVARPLPGGGGGGEIVAVRRAGALVPSRLSRRRYGLRGEMGPAAEAELGAFARMLRAPEERPGQQWGWPPRIPPLQPSPAPTPAPQPAPAKTVKVDFTWVVSSTLEGPFPDAGKGFYVIHDPQKNPVYGGRTDSFRKRMEQYRQYARIFGRKLSDYRVYFAEASGLSDDLLERYVVRSLMTLAGGAVNENLRDPYVLSKEKVVVTHMGKKNLIPDFLQHDKNRKDKRGKKIEHRWDGKKAVTTIAAGAEYELPLLAA